LGAPEKHVQERQSKFQLRVRRAEGWTHPKTAELNHILQRSLDVSGYESGNLPLVEQAEANIMLALPAW
jgi:hypothetical protein